MNLACQNYQLFNEMKLDSRGHSFNIKLQQRQQSMHIKEIGPFAIYLSTFADTRKLSFTTNQHRRFKRNQKDNWERHY